MHTLKEPLPEALARALSARGYDTLTPVQRAVLGAPAARDLLVSSRTGSGKTMAFGLALGRALLVEARAPSPRPRAIVLAPTRELASQIAGELAWLVSGTGLVVVCVTGGQDPAVERGWLRDGADVVVGSPGRMIDHVSRGALDLGQVGWVVLDEADELLRQGFRDTLDKLLATIPAERTTLMFTATVTADIEALSVRFQKERHRIDADAGMTPDLSVLHEAMIVAPRDRDRALVNVLRYLEPGSALVFCGRRENAAGLYVWLRKRGFSVVLLSGALEQSERTRALAALRTGHAQICVATDLASRGLDVPGIDLVVHADLPADVLSLVHRSGRTGRARRRGHAIFLVAGRDRTRLARLVRRAGRPLRWRRIPDPADILLRDAERIVSDPLFGQQETGDEHTLALALMRAHSPHRLAVAFGRLWLEGRPVPESLGDRRGRGDR